MFRIQTVFHWYLTFGPKFGLFNSRSRYHQPQTLIDERWTTSWWKMISLFFFLMHSFSIHHFLISWIRKNEVDFKRRDTTRDFYCCILTHYRNQTVSILKSKQPETNTKYHRGTFWIYVYIKQPIEIFSFVRKTSRFFIYF